MNGIKILNLKSPKFGNLDFNFSKIFEMPPSIFKKFPHPS